MNDPKKHGRERLKLHPRNRTENQQRLAAATCSASVLRGRLNRCAQLANTPIEAFRLMFADFLSVEQQRG